MARSDGLLEYELPGGWRVLVGLSAADNDRLTTRIAAPNDWWFHVDDVPGSHVVLRSREDEEPSRETLKQAAGVAAYHSKARAAGTVPVLCALAKHVRKPRRAEAGSVLVSRGVTLKVRPGIGTARRVLPDAASR